MYGLRLAMGTVYVSPLHMNCHSSCIPYGSTLTSTAGLGFAHSTAYQATE